MHQVAPVVEGQSTSIDKFGFYVSVAQAHHSTQPSVMPAGAAATFASPSAACDDSSDATTAPSLTPHPATPPPPTGTTATTTKWHHNIHAQSVRAQPEISAMAIEERFWLSHIVQYMHLEKMYRAERGNSAAARGPEAHGGHDQQGDGLEKNRLDKALDFDDAGVVGSNAATMAADASASLCRPHPRDNDMDGDDNAVAPQHVDAATPTTMSQDGGVDENDVASLHRYNHAQVEEDDPDVARALARRIAATMRRHVVLHGGVVFPCLRRVVWGFFSGSLQRPPSTIALHIAKYHDLASTPIDPEISDVIQRDLGRTLPTHCLFRDSASLGQVALRRILCAYSALDPAVGYCQGMGFIVSMLLLHAPEEESFWLLVHMMQGRQFALRQLYLPGFPLLQQFFIILRRLLRTFLPTLHRHFEAEGIDVSFFAAQWFMTLFVYQLPISVAARIWDLFLCRGWVVVFQVALALLQWDADRLLGMSMEDALLYLKEFHDGKDEDEIIRRALDVPLHEDDLRTAMHIA